MPEYCWSRTAGNGVPVTVTGAISYFVALASVAVTAGRRDRDDHRDHHDDREHRPRASTRLRRCRAAAASAARLRSCDGFGDGAATCCSRGHRIGRVARARYARAPTIVQTISTADQQEAAHAIHANVTNPSFSNHGAVHGAPIEHELLSANAGTRSTSQW